jgi:Domain of unknown function (DUF5076)
MHQTRLAKADLQVTSNTMLSTMSQLPHELDVPPGVAGDPDAFEMARIWAAHGKQIVCMNLNTSVDPAQYGLMLVDLARHIARAYGQKGTWTEAIAIQRVFEGVNMELAMPTDLGSGAFEQ